MGHTERERHSEEDRGRREKERVLLEVSGSLKKGDRLLQGRSLQFEVEYISE